MPTTVSERVPKLRFCIHYGLLRARLSAVAHPPVYIFRQINRQTFPICWRFLPFEMGMALPSDLREQAGFRGEILPALDVIAIKPIARGSWRQQDNPSWGCHFPR
jgi:hypothetical protein